MTHDPSLSDCKNRKTKNRKNLRNNSNSVSPSLFVVNRLYQMFQKILSNFEFFCDHFVFAVFTIMAIDTCERILRSFWIKSTGYVHTAGFICAIVSFHLGGWQVLDES